MSESTIGKIIPAYQGDLTNKLIWDQDKLNTLSKRADLRTTITIKEGEAEEGRTYESLGETLIWKKFGNPMDLFRRRVGHTNAVEVSADLPRPTADVTLNYRVIMDEVRNTNNGKFDENLFTRSIDKYSRQAIGNVIGREKFNMVIKSALTEGVEMAFIGAGIWGLYFTASGKFSGLFLQPPTMPLAPDMKVIDSYLHYSLVRGTELLIAMHLGLVNFSLIYRHLKDGFTTRESSDPYERGFNDLYNPFKHSKDYLKGYMFLKRNSLVNLDTDNP